MSVFASEQDGDPAHAALRRMHRAHLRDGVPEMVLGVMLLLCAGSFWIPGWVGSRRVSVTAEFVFWLGFIGLCVSSKSIVRWIRDRYLLDRVGYAEGVSTKGGRQRKRGVLVAALLLAIVLLLVAMVVRPSDLDGWILAGNGILFGLLSPFVTDNPRLWVYGALTAALGMGLAFLGLPGEKGLAILYSSTGILYLISGAVVLVLFLRKPVEAETA